jgi:hypothetical protein
VYVAVFQVVHDFPTARLDRSSPSSSPSPAPPLPLVPSQEPLATPPRCVRLVFTVPETQCLFEVCFLFDRCVRLVFTEPETQRALRFVFDKCVQLVFTVPETQCALRFVFDKCVQLVFTVPETQCALRFVFDKSVRLVFTGPETQCALCSTLSMCARREIALTRPRISFLTSPLSLPASLLIRPTFVFASLSLRLTSVATGLCPIVPRACTALSHPRWLPPLGAPHCQCHPSSRSQRYLMLSYPCPL